MIDSRPPRPSGASDSRVLVLHTPEPITVGLGPYLGAEFEVAYVGAGARDPVGFLVTFDPALLVVELRRDCTVPLSVGKHLKRLRPTTRAGRSRGPGGGSVDRGASSGLEGLVVDPADVGEVAECVRRVRDGQLALDQRTLLRVARQVSRRLRALHQVGQVLTAREVEIAGLAGSGCSAKEIAKRLFVSEGTIKVHLHNVFSKLGV